MSGLPDIRVQIFGSEYRIASDADPEHVREVARYIDRKMREVAHTLSLRSISTIAVLTAVNIADELFKIREEDRQIDQLVRDKANQLADSTRIT